MYLNLKRVDFILSFVYGHLLNTFSILQTCLRFGCMVQPWLQIPNLIQADKQANRKTDKHINRQTDKPHPYQSKQTNRDASFHKIKGAKFPFQQMISPFSPSLNKPSQYVIQKGKLDIIVTKTGKECFAKG